MLFSKVHADTMSPSPVVASKRKLSISKETGEDNRLRALLSRISDLYRLVFIMGKIVE